MIFHLTPGMVHKNKCPGAVCSVNCWNCFWTLWQTAHKWELTKNIEAVTQKYQTLTRTHQLTPSILYVCWHLGLNASEPITSWTVTSYQHLNGPVQYLIVYTDSICPQNCLKPKYMARREPDAVAGNCRKPGLARLWVQPHPRVLTAPVSGSWLPSGMHSKPGPLNCRSRNVKRAAGKLS